MRKFTAFLFSFSGFIIAAVLFVGGSVVAAAAFPYATGGTGTTTPNIGQLVWWGSTNQKGVGTTTVSCGSGASCTSFTVIGNSPVTITSSGVNNFLGTTSPWTIGNLAMVFSNSSVTSVGTSTHVAGTGINIGNASTAYVIGAQPTFALKNWLSTSTAETAGGLAYWTSTNGTPASLGTVATNTVSCSSGVSCTSFNALASGAISITNSGVTSLVAGTGITVSGATGAVTVAQKNYISTSTADTANQVLYWNTTNATPAGITSNSGLTFDGTKLTFNYSSSTLFSSFISASSTALSVGSTFIAPVSASTTLTTTGTMGINTATGSSSIRYYDGTNDVMLPDITDVAFSYINYPTSGTGTSTFIIKGGPRGRVFVNASCASAGAGTANAQLGSGTASTTMIVASAAGTNNTTLSSNNVFQAFQDVQIAIGTFSSTGTTTVSCSYGKRVLY